METFHFILYGFSVALQPANLMCAFLGAVAGTLVGVLPGLGPVGAMSMLLPVTYGMSPTGAMIMLASERTSVQTQLIALIPNCPLFQEFVFEPTSLCVLFVNLLTAHALSPPFPPCMLRVNYSYFPQKAIFLRSFLGLGVGSSSGYPKGIKS